MPQLSDEQQELIDKAVEGFDCIVRATVGSGKTSTINELCDELALFHDKEILYLTYSKLLKQDAQKKVHMAKVQNYHGIVFPYLLDKGIRSTIQTCVQVFVDHFDDVIRPDFAHYDVLVIDEYQDITSEYAELLWKIKSTNPDMQVIMVGDPEQKINVTSRFDVEEFVDDFTRDDCQELTFTQSFRIGPEISDKLSLGWGKTVNGVNYDQSVELMSYDDALLEMQACEPGEMIVLGQRMGLMARALNDLESEMPTIFNKSTVYASIRETDDNPKMVDQNIAIFTTYDASKGLERPTAFVFDADLDYWRARMDKPNVEPGIMRNKFLVAFSRGKERIIFVHKNSTRVSGQKDELLGLMPVQTFVDVTKNLHKPKVMLDDFSELDMNPSSCYDFKYKEDIDECLDLIELETVEPAGEMVDIPSTDGLIDISAPIGHLMTTQYFGFNRLEEVLRIMAEQPVNRQNAFVVNLARRCVSEYEKAPARDKPWLLARATMAIDTLQERYVAQVTQQPSDEAMAQLVDRLSSRLPASADCEMFRRMDLGISTYHEGSLVSSSLVFKGRVDVVHDKDIWELKCVNTLKTSHFLQTALYAVMSKKEYGYLWNVKSGELVRVSVPDRDEFLASTVKCVTMGQYDEFVEQ